MVVIGICDDHEFICEDVKNRCEILLQALNLKYQIHIFHSGDEFLNSSQKIDILFLDFEMPGIDGWQTGKQLRKRNDNLIIIMLTAHEEIAKIGYEINIFRHLSKPIEDDKFKESLNAAIKEHSAFKFRKILLQTDESTFIVSEKEIILIESMGDTSAVYTKNHGILQSKYTMKHWKQALNDIYFVQIHKSYIVSYHYIDHISKDNKHVMLKNNEMLKISKRSVQAFKDGYHEFLRIINRMDVKI